MNLKYRKKPVVIEAFQMTLRRMLDNRDWPEWLNAAWQAGDAFAATAKPAIVLITLEGELTAAVDDYIIRGVKGELYPCKPDIFRMTYEEVDAPDSTDAPPLGVDKARQYS